MFVRLSALAVGIACLIGNVERTGAQDKKDPKDKKVDPKKWDLAGFIKKVESLPAEEQVKIVQEKLQELNAGFRDFRSVKIEDGAVKRVNLDTKYISDISPVRAFARLIDLEATPAVPVHRAGKLTDINALKGLKLERLVVSGNPVHSITAVGGMPLATLVCDYTNVADLAALDKCHTLEILNCNYSAVTSLKPLKGLKLRHALCSYCKGPNGATISDVTPLKDMKLEKLGLGGTSAPDYSVIKPMPIEFLILSETPIADFSVLKNLPLTDLYIAKTRLTEKDGDSFLKGKQLKTLDAAGTLLKDIKFVKGMPLTGLDLRSCRQLADLQGLQDSRELVWLAVSQTAIKDLKPLAGLSLKTLTCENTRITSLEPLKGAPLENLRLSCDPKFINGISQVADLSPLAEMKLQTLTLENTSVKDLKPLTGQPLTLLYLDGAPVKDIKPLAGSPLRTLSIQKTAVADLAPLKSMDHLEDLKCDIQLPKDAALLKGLKALKTLNGVDPAKLIP
jgi:Leucine-rich repeat (LRR) protein